MKKEKWFVGALLSSFAVNLFLAGMIVSVFLHAPPRHPGHMPPPAFFIESMAEKLSSQDADALRSLSKDVADRLDSTNRLHREAMRNLSHSLLAEPFDEAALNKALERLEEAGKEMHTAFADFLRKAAITLSAEGRRQLVPPMPRPHGPLGGPPQQGY